MRDPRPAAVLTNAKPEHDLGGQIGDVKRLSSSGLLDGATIKVQHKNRKADAWADNPNVTFVADAHLAYRLQIQSPYNRVVIPDATGNTDVALFV